MSAPRATYSILSGSTSVTGLVGSRIQPAHLPNKPTLPAVTFQQMSATREPASAGENNPVEARMQVDSWAGTYAGVEALSAAVRGAMDRHEGTDNGVVVQHVFLVNELDIYEEAASDAEGPTWRKIQDYIVHYEE